MCSEASRSRTQVRVQPVGTRKPEVYLQDGCSYLRWAHSRELSWVAMIWVMPNKSVSQRVYHINQSIFDTAFERSVCTFNKLEWRHSSVFLLNRLIYLHPNICFPAELLKLSDFQVNTQWTKDCSTFTYLNSARSINTQAVDRIFTIHN